MNGVLLEDRAHGGQAVDESLYVRARPLLGTLVEIAARGPSIQSAVEEAFRAIDGVHHLMSYHDPLSDVSRINREAASHAVPVSRHTWRVLKAAREIAQASDGLFDITVAPTLAAWGFLPRHPDFPRAAARGNWQDVELLPDSRVRFSRPVRIDLGGIAKGYAVDRAIDVLQSLEMRLARVNAGGDLRVVGDRDCPIRVRRPGAPTELVSIAKISGGAAATSADYFTTRSCRGLRVTPLVHPHTCASSMRGRSVTVLAPDCLTADALTKVVHADPLRASAVLGSFSAQALILQESEDGCHMAALPADNSGCLSRVRAR